MKPKRLPQYVEASIASNPLKSTIIAWTLAHVKLDNRVARKRVKAQLRALMWVPGFDKDPRKS
jgi:hypothetical protein